MNIARRDRAFPARFFAARRDNDGETLRSIARTYNVSAATISRLSL